ncbi:ZINC-FINGER HOMEODOMAIN PROTEIN 2 [Salix koriyanagi]|uniref:ZINC-FINGER HOMEODOMAIN PROTEIN 2 n=1 Tax=Salix koriyanagi TaxID=2511006 RepID=A0A9Q1A4B2_9ROSI|nr:ZINC-FINGER HOMEODOMAIN PROTEIN 2 [Salix koriyanagi]
MANTDSKSRPVGEESRTTTEYRECWRNHAVLAGGSAVDGCGEFTPKGDRGTKEAFICEACGCHRNFHRKQSVKNGVVILDTHHSPPPYRLYGVSMWVEKNAAGFNPIFFPFLSPLLLLLLLPVIYVPPSAIKSLWSTSLLLLLLPVIYVPPSAIKSLWSTSLLLLLLLHASLRRK